MKQRWQQTGLALGSDVVLTIVCSDTTDRDAVFAGLWQSITDFENRFSRFMPDSELTMLNLLAGEQFRASPEMVELLDACMYFAERTKGIFNPFILPSLQKAGYKGSWPSPQVHDHALDMSSRIIATDDVLQIDGQLIRIPANTALDFGGIGKGYLLDKLGEQLQAQNITDFWLSLGGDVLCCGHDSGGEDWMIEIAAAEQPDKTVARVSNDKGESLAIATSGITKRRGKGWHHLIDPRTGQPSDSGVLSATVVALHGVEADIYAKVLVLEPDMSADHGVASALKGSVIQTAEHVDCTGQAKEYSLGV
jgi:thiamine biosynthesis lipoprotein